MEKRKRSSAELLLIFQKFLTNSGFIIVSTEKLNEDLNNFYKIVVDDGVKKVTFYVNLRNISSAFIHNKPYILRRQVNKININSLPENKEDSVVLLIGIAEIVEEFVLVVWNAFYFIGHQKK
ncbi:hypothetical protein [Mycoplasma struthionis]|uniref:Uncharacterized protein n=1 Tax=Mycoplasma struthionis TaxID=538220 RepID=A0A502M974_9MOLU|nr:hypothetical protein [Mycoplasma struthionis]TPI02369.1 hypothetical protein FJM01_00775 [Mycoplasma struthionis]